MEIQINEKPNGFVEVVQKGVLGMSVTTVIPPDRMELRNIMKDPLGNEVRLTHSREAHWQTAHSHIGIKEHYTVLYGWIAIATMVGKNNFKIDFIVSQPNSLARRTLDTKESHNVFLPKGAVISVTKEGVPVPNKQGDDWYDDKALDGLLREVTLESLMAKANNDGIQLEREFPTPKLPESTPREILKFL
ncbi:MAG: hypothetical protein R3B60_01790 [Candidatus Paceibacterota bacterium]